MLTDLQCKNAAPKAKDYSLGDGQGLHLCITSAGGKIWRSRYSFLGKWKWYSIGPYPEVTIAKAREEHRNIREMVRNNIDPTSHRKTEKKRLLAEYEATFAKVADMWFQHKKTRIVEKHAKATWQRIENNLIQSHDPKAALGAIPISKIDSTAILRALKVVEARGVHDLARRLKQNCGEIFEFAMVHGLVKANPAAFKSDNFLSKYEKKHLPSIDPDRIPDLLKDIQQNKARMYRPTAIALELMMLTFVRTTELIEARWDEFEWDVKEWVIPAARMKMRRPHVVPLCRQALALLTELKTINGHREFLFPNRNDPRRCMSNATILQALYSMGYKRDMTGHGFRALAMTTIKEKLNYRHEVIDLQLAHAKKDKIQAAYDRTTFIDERHTMMQAWGDFLDKQARGGLVVTMRKVV